MNALTSSTHVMILGGTGEAAQLAELLATDPQLLVTTSLAGRTEKPFEPPGQLRKGGFGGVAGLIDYLRREGIAAVVDATHPYAARMGRNAAAACAAANVPLLRLERPAWQREPGDIWYSVSDIGGAIDALRALGRRVFLTLGPTAIIDFAQLSDHWFLIRQVDPPSQLLPFADYEVVIDRGPFDQDAEEALMRQHRIDVLVTRNAGGEATRPKLAAARRLQIPVIMIARPPRPNLADRVETAAEAATWLRRLRSL